MGHSEAASVIKELMAYNLNLAADSLDQANSRMAAGVPEYLNGFERFQLHWRVFLEEYSKAVTAWWLETVDSSCSNSSSAMKLWTEVFSPLMHEGFLVVMNERIQTLNQVVSQNNMTAEQRTSLNDWADKVIHYHIMHFVVGTNQANEKKAREKFNGPTVKEYRLYF